MGYQPLTSVERAVRSWSMAVVPRSTAGWRRCGIFQAFPRSVQYYAYIYTYVYGKHSSYSFFHLLILIFIVYIYIYISIYISIHVSYFKYGKGWRASCTPAEHRWNQGILTWTPWLDEGSFPTTDGEVVIKMASNCLMLILCHFF